MREQGTRRIDFAWLAAIALAAVLLRLVALASYESAHPLAGTPVIDEASYDQWARRIAAGDWLGGREVWFQEPLYPYALAVIYKFLGDTLHAARVVQCVLWGLAAFLVGATTRRLFGRAACFVAAGMVALHGAGMVFPALLLKENLFLPLCAATAWLLVASRSAQGARAAGAWWLLGACVGAGALLRGNMLVLAPAFALWPVGRALVERRRGWTPWAHAALVVLGVASFLGPVLWRNHAVGGVAVLTTSGAGTNLYGGNNAENPWGRATEFSFIRGIPEHEAGDWRREAERRTGRALDPKETSDYWMGEVLRSARRDPLLHARILWNKLRLTLGAYEVPDNHMIDWDARFVPLARVLPSWGIFGLLGLAGALCFAMLALARRPPTLAVRCRGGAVELLLFLLLYLGTIVLTVTSDRSRLPLLALVAPFGGWIAAAAWALARERRWRALSMPILASCGAALFVHLPSLPAGERAKDMDEREYNLCVVLRDRGGEEEARPPAVGGPPPSGPRAARACASCCTSSTSARPRGARTRRASRSWRAWAKPCAPETSSCRANASAPAPWRPGAGWNWAKAPPPWRPSPRRANSTATPSTCVWAPRGRCCSSPSPSRRAERNARRKPSCCCAARRPTTKGGCCWRRRRSSARAASSAARPSPCKRRARRWRASSRWPCPIPRRDPCAPRRAAWPAGSSCGSATPSRPRTTSEPRWI
jgi:hypothetical protein